MPPCEPSDVQCFAQLDNAGLGLEFEKIGRPAIIPLLALLKGGNPTEAARAVELLHVVQEHVRPAEGLIILDAWRRDVYGVELLAAHFATREFVFEVMDSLRRHPEKYGKAWQTFTNFRDWDEKPNGINAAIAEHIDCSVGEPCDPAFAKLQLAWLESNKRPEENIVERFKQAIANPLLDTDGKITALQYFRPSEYGRTKHQLQSVAVPYLRSTITSGNKSLRDEAAVLLAMYGVGGAQSQLIAGATDTSRPASERTRYVDSLAQFYKLTEVERKAILPLLRDADWNVRRHATILVGQVACESETGAMIAQISPQDWLTSYSAVSALRECSNKGSEQALQRVAHDYWHPVVRDAARLPASTDPNLAQYPPEEVDAVKFANALVGSSEHQFFDRQDSLIQEWCKSRFKQDGYRFVPDFITGPEVVEEANMSSESNAEHEEKLLLNRDDMSDAYHPGLEIQFKGWRLKGATINPTDSDDYGSRQGQLIASKDGMPAQVLLPENIAAVFFWRSEPYVVTAGLRFRSQGMLYHLNLDTNGIWSVEPILRLTGTAQEWGVNTAARSSKSLEWVVYSRVWRTENRIGILGSDGAMIVYPDGSPRWVGCSAPTFP